MIAVEDAEIVLSTGVQLKCEDQRVLALSKKGLAAAFYATASKLYEECNGDILIAQRLNLFSGLYWIKDRLNQMRADFSFELSGLDIQHKSQVDEQFLTEVILTLEQ